jgi:prepilin-type N-terminal cleavage/methylation domain-containing protein
MRTGRHGFTLIELLAVVALLVLLVMLFSPGYFQVREGARLAACLSNMRQIGSAVILYTADNEGVLPHHTGGNGVSIGNVYDMLEPYIGRDRTGDIQKASVFKCPSGWARNKPDPGWNSPFTVAYNYHLLVRELQYDELPPVISNYRRAKNLMMFACCGCWQSNWRVWGNTVDHFGYQIPTMSHGGTIRTSNWVNRYDYYQDGRGAFIFADGHAEALSPELYMFERPAGGPQRVRWEEFWHGN